MEPQGSNPDNQKCIIFKPITFLSLHGDHCHSFHMYIYLILLKLEIDIFTIYCITEKPDSWLLQLQRIWKQLQSSLHLLVRRMQKTPLILGLHLMKWWADINLLWIELLNSVPIALHCYELYCTVLYLHFKLSCLVSVLKCMNCTALYSNINVLFLSNFIK